MINPPPMIPPVSTEKVRSAFPGIQVVEQFQLEGKALTETELNVKAFDWCIDHLRRDFSDRHLNEAFTILWRLIGNKRGVGVVQTERSDGIKELHIAGIRTPPMALIMLPPDFYRQFIENPVYQMGAIVFVGHQALELCKHMVSDRWLVLGSPFSEQIRQEALRAEGRFLMLYSKQNPLFEPNDYQRQLIDGRKS